MRCLMRLREHCFTKAGAEFSEKGKIRYNNVTEFKGLTEKQAEDRRKKGEVNKTRRRYTKTVGRMDLGLGLQFVEL